MNIAAFRGYICIRYQGPLTFSNSKVDGETIFESFLDMYNPDKEQQDACDFLNYLLD